MWNNCAHFLHKISEPSTPRSSPSSPSYEQKTLSPHVQFPHLYRGHNFDPSIQLPQPASPRRTFYANQASVSPVYAYPYRPTGNTSLPSNSSPRIQPSPHGVYPRHLYCGHNFDLSIQLPQPASPRRTFYANQASVSPVYAYPYRPTGNTSLPSNSSPRIQPSPHGVYPRHLYCGHNFDLSIQLPQPASPWRTFYANQASVSPVYAYPYRPTGNTSLPSNSSPRIQPSPHGVYPRHLNIGIRFGLVPATPRTRAAEEDETAQRWWPSTVELVGSLSVGCGEASKTRGIGPGQADGEAPVRVDRFKIRTVDIDETIVQGEGNKK